MQNNTNNIKNKEKKFWGVYIDALCNHSHISTYVFESILYNISKKKVNKYKLTVECSQDSQIIHKETVMAIYKHLSGLLNTKYTIHLNTADDTSFLLTKQEADAIFSCEKGKLDEVTGLPVVHS